MKRTDAHPVFIGHGTDGEVVLAATHYDAMNGLAMRPASATENEFAPGRSRFDFSAHAAHDDPDASDGDSAVGPRPRSESARRTAENHGADPFFR